MDQLVEKLKKDNPDLLKQIKREKFNQEVDQTVVLIDNFITDSLENGGFIFIVTENEKFTRFYSSLEKSTIDILNEAIVKFKESPNGHYKTKRKFTTTTHKGVVNESE